MPGRLEAYRGTDFVNSVRYGGQKDIERIKDKWKHLYGIKMYDKFTFKDIPDPKKIKQDDTNDEEPVAIKKSNFKKGTISKCYKVPNPSKRTDYNHRY